MTFTELELVLLCSCAFILFLNYQLNKLLNTHREAHAVLMTCINGVADKKAVFYRDADGNISCKRIHSLENTNGATN